MSDPTDGVAGGLAARPGGRLRLRVLLGFLVGVLILGGIVATRMAGGGLLHWAETVVDATRGAGPAGWAAFALAQAAVAMIGVLPASLLGIAAGAVYGLWLGFCLSAIGTLAGGWLAFLLARSLLRPWIAGRLASLSGGRLADLDAAIARDGWRLVCLLRISPIMPFALTSYALGLTHISQRDYLIGTLAALPALAGYVAAGVLAGRSLQLATGATGVGGPLQWLLLAVGGVATALLILRSGTLLASCGLLPDGPARLAARLPFQPGKR